MNNFKFAYAKHQKQYMNIMNNNNNSFPTLPPTSILVLQLIKVAVLTGKTAVEKYRLNEGSKLNVILEESEGVTVRARKVIKVQHSDLRGSKKATMTIQRLNAVVSILAAINFYVKLFHKLSGDKSA